jgi:hypothetical protein
MVQTATPGSTAPSSPATPGSTAPSSHGVSQIRWSLLPVSVAGDPPSQINDSTSQAPLPDDNCENYQGAPSGAAMAVPRHAPTGGQHRRPAALQISRSASLSRRSELIPKLRMRVQFPSSALSVFRWSQKVRPRALEISLANSRFMRRVAGRRWCSGTGTGWCPGP